MKKLQKILLVVSLMLIPIFVFASSDNIEFPIFDALIFEVTVSIASFIFILWPLAELISEKNTKKTFWLLFALRFIILLFCYFFVSTNIMIVDFVAVALGAFLIDILKRNLSTKISNPVIKTPELPGSPIKGIELKCAKCGTVLQITDELCSKCGEPFTGNNVVVSESATASVEVPAKIKVTPTSFDKIYSLTEDEMLEEFIKKQLVQADIDETTMLIPSEILRRKKVLNIIFSLLVFVAVISVFFHYPNMTYIVEAIILFIFYKITKNYNLIKYLKKQLKARPEEKVTNIVMNVKNTFVTDDTKKTINLTLLVAIVLPLIIFSSPRILYEKTPGGYAVRYYMFGLTNFKTVTIPETYENEKVVSLRGNTFSNMPFLVSVSLPDSITEIRGQAFKDCSKLKSVNIPKNLEYLGGGAFYNAKSIIEITLPDSLTYLGGEAFYNAKSLKYVKLSDNITEIKGNTFENCTSLKSITIPDNVSRIGGHAFYGDYSLNEVIISKNSQLATIGSSAFRECTDLYKITIPARTSVNERAFKGSPTTIKRYSSNY